MKKRIVRGLIALALVVGGGTAITMTSNDVHACTKCDTNNASRKCGECGSDKLFAKKIFTHTNGKQRTNWKCEKCGHQFTTELRNGKEVVLKGNE